MNWARSHLFWKITGLYALFSAMAVIGLLAALSSRLSSQSDETIQRDSTTWLSQLCEELAETQDDPTTAQVVSRWRESRLPRETILRITGQQLNPEIESESGLSMPVLESVVNAAGRSGFSFRWLNAADSERRLILARRIEDSAAGQGDAIESDTADPDSSLAGSSRPAPRFGLLIRNLAFEDSRQNEFVLIAAQTAGFTWLIGLTCVSLIAMGLVGPLQSLTLNLSDAATRSERQEMLLELSDRGDELGNVAQSLTQLEGDRQQRITELEDAEGKSRAAVDLLSAVLNSMVEGVLAVDQDERMLFLNSAARELLGISDAIRVGHRIYEAARVPAILDAVSETLRTSERQSLEFRTVRGGRYLTMIINPFPSSVRTGAVVVVRDVSELRRLESMRRDFISGVSHELKTPLTVIQACTDTLLGGALEDPVAAQRFVQKIEDQSERLMRLILGMLQLARVESGAEVLRNELLDLRSVADEVVEAIAPVAALRRIHTEVTGVPQLEVTADYQAVRTIISNLVDNAVRHSHDGGTVTLQLRQTGSAPEVLVMDRGIGIPQEHLPRIFERFYRIDRDRSRERGGTGLGLAIVKHLCQAMNAEVSVRSEPGQGTEFRVVFPGS